MLGPVRTCSDPFGCVRMRSEASGSVLTFLENFKKHFEKSFENMFFCDFVKVLEELDANGPQNQLPHQILLQIHLS